MGTWNAGLFFNDTTCDIRDTYIEFLKQQLSNEDAYHRTFEEYEELIGTDEEPLFWYALADTQWSVGRLNTEVKEHALDCIQKNAWISNWERNQDIIKWKKTLQKLEEKINSPMPPEKKFRKPIEFERNPWSVGDVYAYQFHTDKAIESGFYGKYIVLQKIGNVEYYKGITFSAIQVFNKVFDCIPVLEEIDDICILPLVYSPATDGYPRDVNDYVPSIECYMKATMIYEKRNDYPKQYLKFVGNKKIEEQYDSNVFSAMYWSKDDIDDWLIDYYLSWQNVEY